MKLRNLFCLLLALPMLAVGCSNEPDAQDVVLSSTMESDIMKFDADGGGGVITYVLKNASEGASVEVACEADWVVNLKVGKEVSFSVLPNEGDSRATEIVVSYKGQSFKVSVEQAARERVYDHTFNAELFYAVYVGVQDTGAHNYYVMVSDLGFDPYGNVMPGAMSYCFDLFSVEPVVGANGSKSVPYGTYLFDENDTGTKWTVGKSGSDYTLANADGSDYDEYELFDELTVVVSESGIVAIGVIKGDTYKIVYDGAPMYYSGR